MLVLRLGVSLGPVHRRRALEAAVDPALVAQCEARARALGGTADAVLDAALEATEGALRFGLWHASSMSFRAGRAREGNCVEYAQLYGALAQRVGARLGLPLRVTVLRSDARLFGLRVPGRAFADHDWVLVQGAGEARYVDASFADVGLGQSVRWNVRGAVP